MPSFHPEWLLRWGQHRPHAWQVLIAKFDHDIKLASILSCNIKVLQGTHPLLCCLQALLEQLQISLCSLPGGVLPPLGRNQALLCRNCAHEESYLRKHGEGSFTMAVIRGGQLSLVRQVDSLLKLSRQGFPCSVS